MGEATFPKEGVHIQNSLDTALHLPDVQVRHPEVTGIPLGLQPGFADQPSSISSSGLASGSGTDL